MKPIFSPHNSAALVALVLGAAVAIAGHESGEVTASAATAPVLYSHGDPTADEQYLLELLNHARMDPAGEGQRLAVWLRLPAQSSLVSAYDIDPDAVASEIAAFPAVPPLAFNAALITAARAHSADLAPHDGVGPGGDSDPTQDHFGYDGSTPASRVAAAGYTGPGKSGGFSAENYGPGSDSPYSDHAGFEVDWGNPGLGHRHIAFAGGAVREVGIGLATKPTTLNSAYPLVTTEDYGWPGVDLTQNGPVIAPVPALLVGVAYVDANGNGQYDPGEGIAGVQITMADGQFYTVTSASGGYALPLVNANGTNADGAVTVRISGIAGEGDRDVQVAVTHASSTYGPYRANAKYDIVTGSSVTAPAATVTVTAAKGGVISRADGGKLKVTLRRANTADLSQALTVKVKAKGTAVPGVDYVALPKTVTIPAGAVKVTLKIRPIAGGAEADLTRTIALKVADANGKTVVHIMP